MQMDLPVDFINNLKSMMGDEAGDLLSALDTTAPVSIRLNPAKEAKIVASENVSWFPFGRYLEERPAFTFDPLLHAGCYYVQEASSMFVGRALMKAFDEMGGKPVKILDLCAAPGGKSTLAASVMPEDSLLVSNEIIRSRANILAENIVKWGNPDVIVTQAEPSSFSGLMDIFDVMMTDVPCSGEGMFRKDSSSISEWSDENVRMCASRQRSILNDCWPALKPGGFLIYSTCTYNVHEDEENVDWICRELGAELIGVPVNEEWNISGAKGQFSAEIIGGNNFPVYRFLPHKTKGEGFFLALMRKNWTEEVSASDRIASKSKSRQKKKEPAVPEICSRLLKEPEKFEIFSNRQNSLTAIKKEHLSSLRMLEERLKIVHAGIILGEIKGKDFLPDVSVALSASLDISSVKTFELDLKQAVSYLRGEQLILSEDLPKSWIIVLYEGHPLGWIKNLGNRANNGWPKEWRIRSENPYV